MSSVRAISIQGLILIAGCSTPGPAPSAPTQAASAAHVEFFPVEGRTLPFSKAVRVGEMLYLSGDIGVDSTGKLVAGGIGPETTQALENIKATLARHGATMNNVVKCTVMLADMAEWGKMNEAYVTFFPEHFPARSAFGTSGLALGARMELECLAVLGDR